MTMPKLARVRDMVLAMIPQLRHTLTQEEADLGTHLRGNTKLYESLIALVASRISTRANQPVPDDPLVCRGLMERDHELRVLLARLESVYRSPVNTPAEDGDQPA